MKHWDSTLLRDCTLHDYSHVMMLTGGWGEERIYVRNYFGEQPYITTTEYTNDYQHFIAQYAQAAFFEKKLGFTKTLEVSLDRGFVMSPVFEDIDCGPANKTFKGYSDACVGYTVPNGHRVLVRITRQESDDVEYEVHTHPDEADIKSLWFAFARSVHNFYKGQKITAGCKFLELRDVGWGAVVLPPATKRLLSQFVISSMRLEAIYRKNKITLKGGLLLSGKPGNGKTSAVRAVINEVPEGTSVIYALPSHLEKAQNVRMVCNMAKDISPSVLVFEDIDWIAEERGDSQDAGKVIELMNQLDGIEDFPVITIGTTNHVDRIENAIKNRPGRFDRVVTIDDPDEDCRRQMFDMFCRHWVLDTVDHEKNVTATAKLTGAHVAELCKTAAKKAIDAGSLNGEEIAVVTQAHFDAALGEVRNKDYSTWSAAKGKKPIRFGDDDE